MLTPTSKRSSCKRGELVYLRAMLDGYDVWDGKELAIVSLVGKDGKPTSDVAYYIDPPQLIPARDAAAEKSNAQR
jgi:hypothetical protein